MITLGASLNLADQKHLNTALHWAVYSRNGTAVTNLINAGANVFVKNAQSDTPLDMAKKFSIHYIASRLEEYSKEKDTSKKPLYIRIYKDKVSTSLNCSTLNVYNDTNISSRLVVIGL